MNIKALRGALFNQLLVISGNAGYTVTTIVTWPLLSGALWVVFAGWLLTVLWVALNYQERVLDEHRIAVAHRRGRTDQALHDMDMVREAVRKAGAATK